MADEASDPRGRLTVVLAAFKSRSAGSPVDGVERVWENLEGHCDQRAFTVPLSSGIRTIRIGTDQSSFCSSNMALWDIHFQFNAIVPESQHGSWTD